MPFKIANKIFKSRLFLGSGKFSSGKLMKDSVVESGTNLVTVALKRVSTDKNTEKITDYLKVPDVSLLPNTSGAKNAEEAIFMAELAKEALKTNWLKLEIHPDSRYLMPDPIETLKAAEALVKKGFIVLPYINADPVLCKRLEEVGAHAVMPLGSAIGSNKGIRTEDMLEIIIEQSNLPVIVDAGIGAPSHASKALEMGADAVLVNTAIAVAKDPVKTAKAFKLAVEAGRLAYTSGLQAAGSNSPKLASPSSPIESFLKGNLKE